MSAAPGAEGDAGEAAILDALLDDPAHVEALSSEYPGREDLVDALWWRRHPLSTAPSGRPDPALERDRLQHAAFGRDADADAARRLSELERALATERAAVDALLARRTVRPEPEPEEQSAGTNDLPAATTPERRVRPRRSGVVAAVVIAALAVTTGGLAVRLAESQAIISGAAPQQGDDPLDRLDRPQSDGDIPEATLPYDYDPASMRRLLRADQTGLTGDYVLYGARDDRDRVCLVIAFPDERIASSCVSLAELRQQGIRVTANVYRPSRESLGSEVLVSHTVTWQPNDTFEFSSSLADGTP